MTRVALGSMFALFALSCDSPCEGLHAREIDGRFGWQPESYQDHTGPSGGEMVSAQLDASDGRVVFTYELADGSRYRATYRVKSERKEH
jgi:hypothetical protein